DEGTTVTPAKAYDNATMTIDRAVLTSKYVSVANGKSVRMTIKVFTGRLSKTYKLTIKRAKSTNNNLASLTPSIGTLSQPFDPAVLNYSLNLDEYTDRVLISATAAHLLAKTTPKSKLYILKNGQTKVATIRVRAQSGATKIYRVAITRAKSTNANLLRLKTNSLLYPLVPAFSADNTSYTVTLPASVGSVTLTAKKADKYANLTIDGAKKTSKKVVLLNGQTITVNITVTAQAGNTKTYTIVISRP
ncbi:MAG: cadherin-like beta sandwich domain-containing protein, partial [Bacillota bacterium]|nr:cadherin-like beta sandwich domain-containing protein [Bacillota bacterium]